MNQAMDYLERWNDLFGRIGCHVNQDEAFERLVQAYSEKHRAYHNLKHIYQCLDEFDGVKRELANPDLVEIAIWYHDAIYNPRSHRNEEESALLAEMDLKNSGLSAESTKIVSDLILSTKHHDETEDTDTRYLIDIDLSILGAPPEKFKEYETNIRKEYKWVPMFIFRKKRFEILKSFLDRKQIYYTQLFGDKYEQQARININAVLSRA